MKKVRLAHLYYDAYTSYCWYFSINSFQVLFPLGSKHPRTTDRLRKVPQNKSYIYFVAPFMVYPLNFFNSEDIVGKKRLKYLV